MTAARPITGPQTRAVHAAAAAHGYTGGAYRSLLESMFGVRSSRQLTVAQASELLDRLNGKRRAGDSGSGGSRSGDSRSGDGRPRRLPPGTVRLPTAPQRRLIGALAAKLDMDAGDVERFAAGRLKLEGGRPKTSTEARKLIEALRAMCRRKGL